MYLQSRKLRPFVCNDPVNYGTSSPQSNGVRLHYQQTEVREDTRDARRRPQSDIPLSCTRLAITHELGFEGMVYKEYDEERKVHGIYDNPGSLQ